MTIPVKVREGALAVCSDCGSEHLPPVPCGLTFAQRLGSQRIDKSWMPAKRDGGLKNYYDSEALGDAFGADAHEQMMEETKGFGPVTAENLEQARKEPELAEMIDAFYGQAADIDEGSDEDPFADVTGDVGLGPVLAQEPE
jgi:hypothetical protein